VASGWAPPRPRPCCACSRTSHALPRQVLVQHNCCSNARGWAAGQRVLCQGKCLCNTSAAQMREGGQPRRACFAKVNRPFRVGAEKVQTCLRAYALSGEAQEPLPPGCFAGLGAVGSPLLLQRPNPCFECKGCLRGWMQCKGKDSLHHLNAWHHLDARDACGDWWRCKIYLWELERMTCII